MLPLHPMSATSRFFNGRKRTTSVSRLLLPCIWGSSLSGSSLWLPVCRSDFLLDKPLSASGKLPLGGVFSGDRGLQGTIEVRTAILFESWILLAKAAFVALQLSFGLFGTLLLTFAKLVGLLILDVELNSSLCWKLKTSSSHLFTFLPTVPELQIGSRSLHT